MPSKLSKQEETNLSALKQEFIMTVFKNLVPTDEGKSIISKYSSTGKAQELWKKIEAHQKHQLSFSQGSVKTKQPNNYQSSLNKVKVNDIIHSLG